MPAFPVTSSEPPRPSTPGWQFAVAGGILGWVLDAFDFFVLVFLFAELMARFHVEKSAIVWTLTATLAMRPVGALLFGYLADRFGRRMPLIGCVVYFSVITVLSGFAPNFTTFAVLRALYGIGMGGYWGIGASFAMEHAPAGKRGLFSGVMQGGYPFGYLMAAIGMQTIAPRFGWQSMFLVGSLVAVVIVVLTLMAPETATLTQRTSLKTIARAARENFGSFAYLLLVMTVMTSLSHGTQDLYPDFLKSLPWLRSMHLFGMAAVLGIPVVYNIGAITGAPLIGAASERFGRRRAAMISLAICLLAIPASAFGSSLPVIVAGSFLMQFGVQGAFGVIPAHLNELAPDAIRGLFIGFVYQLGVLLASPVPPLQTALQHHFGYSWSFAITLGIIIPTMMLVFFFGPERKGRMFAAG